MELKFRKITEDELSNAQKMILDWSGEPFYFMYFRGELLINRKMRGIRKIMEAITAWFSYDLMADGDIMAKCDAAYDTISQTAGKVAANQACTAWSEAAEASRKAKDESEAKKWISEVYDAMTLDQWDELEGLDHGFLQALSLIISRRADIRCKNYFKAQYEAVFLYGYNCGLEAARMGVS